MMTAGAIFMPAPAGLQRAAAAPPAAPAASPLRYRPSAPAAALGGSSSRGGGLARGPAVPKLQEQRRLAARRQRGSLPRALRVAASADEGGPTPQQPLAAEHPALLVERQEERALVYGAIAGLLGAAGLALAVLPARCVEFVWAAVPANRVVSGLAQSFGGILLLAAVAAYCLKQAAEADHLKSDTYKRLNLALMWWGLGTGLALWLAPQQPLRLALGLCTAVLGATSAHAALTYQETDEQGLNPLYLLRQLLSSLGNLTSYHNDAKSSIYALYAYGLSAKAVVASSAAILLRGQLKLMEDGLMTAPLGALGTSLLPVLGVGYALTAVILFTLKDAAQRGRLGASTFKALNIGVAISALVNTIRMAGWMQAGIIVDSKLAALRVGSFGFLALVCLWNYAFEKKKK